MDGDGVVIGVEHDDFEQAPGGVSADHQNPVAALPYDAERDRDRCKDLLVGDAVPPSALRNLHHDRLPCQAGLSADRCVSLDDRPSDVKAARPDAARALVSGSGLPPR